MPKSDYLSPLGILAMGLSLAIPYIWMAGIAVLGYWMLVTVADMLTAGSDGAAIVMAGVIVIAVVALVIL